MPNNKERLSDVLLQIWNDGAEGIVYSKKDMKEMCARVKSSALREAGLAGFIEEFKKEN